MVLVVDEVALRTEVLAVEDDVEAWRCWGGARAVTVLARARGRLLAAVAVVAVVDAEAVDSAEGDGGWRRVVVEVREVAVDFARACVVVRGDCSLVADVDAMPVDTRDKGREDGVGTDWDGPTIDLGLVSLVLVVGKVRVLLVGSAPSPVRLCVEVGRAAVVFDLLSPKIPEFGLLLEATVDVAVALAPVAAGPTPGRAAVVKAPGLGSLLGDMCREEWAAAEEADVATAGLLLSSRGFFASSLFGTLPRPAVGCRRERVRFSPAAEDEDDMMIRGGRLVVRKVADRPTLPLVGVDSGYSRRAVQARFLSLHSRVWV